jgi:signal transduction histidine kinase
VFSMSMKQGLSSPSVWSVLVARDNSVWLSTLDGLNRWNNGRVTVYRSGALESVRVRRIGHAVPVVSASALPQRAVTEKTDPGLPDDRVGSLYEDDRGRIWVSTPSGIARFDSSRFTRVKELPGGWVNVITGDNHGGVWISYQDQGLLHWLDGKVVETVPWSAFGENGNASALLTDATGGLWLGFFQGGLLHFRDGRVVERYGKNNGFGEGRVMGLELDRDGRLWAATEGGLSRRLKDGHIATMTTANGLPCNTVHWAMETGGSFWLYTACGLLQVPRGEMEKWSADPTSRIQFTIFDSSDGVRSRALLTGYTPRVSKSADGKLWFAHFDSVSVLDPRDLRLNSIPPPVHIGRITADGKSYVARNGLQLPARTHDLAIQYTALSLVAPEKVHFRFMLVGQDPVWREVVNDRRVQYSNLAPGTYRFRVIACNNSGVWNQQGDTLDFSISPAYYQTNWFRALCALLFSALLWAAYELRLKQIHRQYEMMLEARVGERTRIARDLHDTLIQSFHGLLLRFQTVSHLLPERPAEAKDKLDSAIEQAAEAITEGRDAVQGLRASTIQCNDLALDISTLGEELAKDSTNQRPALRVAVEGESRDLHPLVRDEIYKIAAEGLRNAFLHARAKKVEVEIRYDNDRFRLRVRDDGQGIDPRVLSDHGSDGHYGLRGMRERAALMGGELVVWSNVGAGTELELQVPARVVYAKGRKRSWLSRKYAAPSRHEAGDRS